mgnify:CR=1 FL=1
MKGKGVQRALIAGLTTALADGFLLQPLAAKLGLGISDDFVRLGAAVLLPTLVKNQMARDIAMAEGVIGAYNLSRGLAGGLGLGGSTTNAGSVGTL